MFKAKKDLFRTLGQAIKAHLARLENAGLFYLVGYIPFITWLIDCLSAGHRSTID